MKAHLILSEGQRNDKLLFVDVLKQTLDPQKNNLYNFVFLFVDSNIYIFDNIYSFLLNPNTNTILRKSSDGSAHTDSYNKANQGTFCETLEDYGIPEITNAKLVWDRDLAPSPRITGDTMLFSS
ncbi:Aldehyde oxidase GLOX1 [Linum grandiflorum]